jgi:hypothetical protein
MEYPQRTCSVLIFIQIQALLIQSRVKTQVCFLIWKFLIRKASSFERMAQDFYPLKWFFEFLVFASNLVCISNLDPEVSSLDRPL